jgi:hypothetical protein
MKFRLKSELRKKEKLQRRIDRKTVWHKWFAWYPIVVGETLIWLETVEKKQNFYAGAFDSVGRYRHEFFTLPDYRLISYEKGEK